MLTLMTGMALLAQITATAAPQSGEDLLRQMHDAGAGKWYRTLTFVQTTRLPNRPDQTWYESMQLPGLLRIDRAPVDSMNTTIYRGDSTWSFRRGVAGRPRAEGNIMAILFGDVFAQPVSQILTRLAPFHIDLAKVRTDRYDNRPVWVVGGAVGDTLSPQFWVDQQRLYVVRIVWGASPNAIDAKVMAHQPAAGGWVETEIVMYRNGAEIQREIYEQIKVNPVLDPAIFDVGAWKRPGWIP